MRVAILAIVLFTALHAVDITKSVGIRSGEPYLVLTLDDLVPFSCVEHKGTLDTNGFVECHFVNIPAIKPEPSEDSFFQIVPTTSSESFKVKISFKQKAKVYSLDQSIRSNRAIAPMDNTIASRRWVIVGYKKTLPILNSEPSSGLSFPIDYLSVENPSVGALDSTGNIVLLEDNRDSELYERILTLYNQKNYTQALKLVDENLDAVETLFLPEILSIKIRSLDKLGGGQKEIVDLAGTWVKAYTLHNDMPEIMFVLGKAQMWLGQSSEAMANYNIIIREYPESRFADLAKVHRADRFGVEGRIDEASIWYNKVLYNTSDIEAASLAAARLAEIAIKKDEFEKAAQLYDKVLVASSHFFEENMAKSEELLYLMVDNKIYSSAAKLGEIVIKHKEPKSADEEKLLLSLARWNLFAGNSNKAIEHYSRFIDSFPYSKDLFLAQKERDLLLLDVGLESDDENLALYDRIVERYPQDSSASKALYEKSKILLKQGRYSEVKEMLPRLDLIDKNLFQDYDQLIRQIERTLLNSFLLRKECKEAVDLIEQRKLGTTLRSDDVLYGCAFDERAYNLALEIAKINQRKSSKMLVSDWLEKELETLYAMNNYPLFVDRLESFIRMKKAFRLPVEAKHYLNLFKTYYKLEEKSYRLEELVKNMEYYYPKDPHIMDMYFALSHLASRQNDHGMLYDYSKKLLNEQRRRSVRTFSPDNELFFVEAARKLGKEDEAILVLETMELDSVGVEDRARVMFLLGDLLGESERARGIYIECSKLGDNQWSNLCKEKYSSLSK